MIQRTGSGKEEIAGHRFVNGCCAKCGLNFQTLIENGEQIIESGEGVVQKVRVPQCASSDRFEIKEVNE